MEAQRTVRRTGMVATLVAAFSLVLGSLTPAMSAAVISSEAELTEGVQVLPGTPDYSIRVDAPLSSPLNAVLINFPTAFNGVATADGATAPEGWTLKRIDDGNNQALLYTGLMAPGTSQDFPFPATAPAPANGDAAGTFRVQVSSNGGQTFHNAQATGAGLTTTIKVLTIESTAVVGDVRVTDGSGTAGQTITVEAVLRNHATGTVTGVAPKLSSTSSKDTITQAPAADIPGGTTAAFAFQVTLGEAPVDSERTSTFDVDLTQPFTDYQYENGLTRQVQNYAVQAPPRLFADSLTPQYVIQGDPAAIDLTVIKRGIPTLTVESAGTLDFADTSAASTNTAGTPVFGGPDDTQVLSYATDAVAGAEVEDGYTPTAQVNAVDGNGFELDALHVGFSDGEPRIFIDANLPIVTIATSLVDADSGNSKEAAANGDTVEVDVSVDETFGFNVTTAVLTYADGSTVDLSVPENPGDNFTATATVDRTIDLTSFDVKVEVADLAGQIGSDAQGLFEVDNVEPTMRGLAYILPNEQVPFGQDDDDVAAVIEVTFDEFGINPADDALTDDNNDRVRGACDPGSWSVTGDSNDGNANVVVEVRYGDGSLCQRGQAGLDNRRLLVLGAPVDRNASLSVRYDSSAPLADPATDDAANILDEAVADAVSQIAPLAPEIVNVFRNTAGQGDCSNGNCEAAYSEDSDTAFARYFTRFGGEDLLVDFTGERAGYRIQVLDGSNAVVKDLSADGSLVHIPLPDATTANEGTYTFGLRFVNAQGVVGETLTFEAVLDVTSPTLASVSFTSGLQADTATVGFDEPVVEGTNFASDWRIAEEVGSGTGNYYFYSPDEVSGNGESRELTFTPSGQPDTTPVGTKYELQLGEIYRDRAGNAIVSPTPLILAN